MKKILYPFFALIFISQTFIAQNTEEKKPWHIGISLSAIDIKSPTTFEGFLKDYGNASIEDINMYGLPVKLFAVKKISTSLSIQSSLLFNKIKKGYNFDGDSRNYVDDSFFAFQTGLMYHLDDLFGNLKRFDPYLVSGLGYASIRDTNGLTFNADWGLNFWISPTVALQIQSGYNHNFASDQAHFFAHSFGLQFNLGSQNQFSWRKY